MATLFYKDFFVIAMSRFDKQKELCIPVAGIGWHSTIGHEFHTIQDSDHCFPTKQEAEAFALETAKAWIDARIKAA